MDWPIEALTKQPNGRLRAKVDQAIALRGRHGGRKVRTPKDRVADNDGPAQSGESTTENIPPAVYAAGKVEKAR